MHWPDPVRPALLARAQRTVEIAIEQDEKTALAYLTVEPKPDGTG